ncbi:proteasome subunit beta type-4-like [Lineus longissimus]|uniref:proteasome subunit beta type-4-like n=1 Tax=Lineus longissimus TaxID=88925 RepID=UPI002B4E3720
MATFQEFGISPALKMGKQHTMNPMVTATSMIGVKFDGGVMMAGDMLGSYGSLARYRNCPRVMKVNDSTILGASGDYADFQFLQETIKQRIVDEECLDDGFTYTPRSLHSWLTRMLYHRRSNFNPLWNTIVVGGIQDGTPYLGYVDKIGTAYTGSTIATGYGSYIALPLMRDAVEKNPNMSEAEALKLIDDCMKVLFYRDARSFNKYQVAICTAAGARIEGPISSQTNWDVANASQVQD